MSVLAMLDPVALRARVTGTSLWSVRYRDGAIIHEYERDWSLIQRRGLVAVRLYCPNGKVAEFGNSVDASDRLFQLKIGVRSAGVKSKMHTQAHIIGIIYGLNGEAHCAAWEYDTSTLRTFDDNVFAMQYANIGRLSADVLGIRPD